MQTKKRDPMKFHNYSSLLIVLLSFQMFYVSAAASQASVVGITADTSTSTEDFNYDHYDQIKLQKSDVNLLAIETVRTTFPLPVEKYDRKKHFAGWIHFADSNTCLDTRGLVLQRDSATNITTTPNCVVTSGQWHDPYTDNTFTSSKDIQIDHVVPLKHAYMTGAFEWTHKKRCQYANNLSNHFHLLAVNGTENMRKGDRSPLEYIPPNQKMTCEYLKDWLEIKYLWSLRITPRESDKIQELVQTEHCDVKEFVIPQTEITAQVKYIKDHENICVGAALTSF